MEPSTSKKPRSETDFKLCIRCQESGSNVLVSEPSEEAFSKFLQFVHETGRYGDVDFAQFSERLHGYTASNLKDMKAKWHGTCYGSTCHSGHLERAKARYQKACQEGDNQHLQQKRGRPSSGATIVSESAESDTLHFTRSAISPFNVKQCFFCQEDRKEPVHEVCTFSAGRQLQKADDESKNHTWKMQLSATISKDDAMPLM